MPHTATAPRPDPPGRAMADFHDMPGHLIRRAHQISMALFTEECARFELTAVQFAALTAIAAEPGVDATRLSQLIAFDRSTIGGVLERLEAKGWILRTGSPADRRLKLLHITVPGERLLADVQGAVHRVQSRLLEPLPPEDRAAMHRLLARFVAAHGAAA